MIDFAHNPAGYLAIEDFLSNIDSPKKVGIISGVGDRRDEDITECGRIAARMFDHIIIRQEKHLRGRTEQELIDLIVSGINMIKKHQKPNPQLGVAGGIVEKEAAIHASNVAIYNPATKKADRVGFKVLENGDKVRVFKSNGETLGA